MSAKDFARLIDSARMRLPGALDGALKLELFAVLREFTQRSDAWREWIEITTAPPEQEYDLVIDHRGLINRLIVVRDPTMPDQVTVPATMARLGTVRLKNAPSSVVTLGVEVAVTVNDPTDALGFPYFPLQLLQKYHNGLLDGLLSRMMAQPAKPYSSEKGAMFHGRNFLNAINLAKRETRTANLFGGQAWRFPQTFNAR